MNVKTMASGRGQILPPRCWITATLTLTTVATLGSGAAYAAPARAPYQVLYNFTGDNGLLPSDSLVVDKAGNLYGTAPQGGAPGYGVVFKLAPDGTGTTLYSFNGGADGANPHGFLAVDPEGNLYGMTFAGGATGNGTVFKLAPNGTKTVLHDFAGGKDGAGPTGGILRDKSGRLWGSTYFAGPGNDGTVFTVSPSGKERVVFGFSGANGNTPSAVVRDKLGNLYGTTVKGGAGNVGTVFKITPGGAETVLYSFQDGSDGGLPGVGVVLDKSGNLYGTTLSGGPTANGVVFKVTPAGTETVLYGFTGGNDGGVPYGPLLLDKQGDLYGTTSESDGQSGFGVVYKLAADGSETVLHAFASGTDGGAPRGGLIADPAFGRGYLFGTTTGAEDFSRGTIFEIKK
jgi:uncharacterized repeat protein (TIGR03803 family)